MRRILIIVALALAIIVATVILIKESTKKEEFVSVKVFFNNTKLDPEISCNKVFPVKRSVSKAGKVKEETLTELLGGPTASEVSEGFFTLINSGVKLKKLSISGNTATADFDERLEVPGGSCWVSAVRAQITQTLKQFPGIENVIISINGRTEDILQP